MISLSVYGEDGVGTRPTKVRLSALARKTCSLVWHPVHSTLSVAFVSNSTIRSLNKIYRGNDRVTDVLSFCYEYTHELLEGEIVISKEAAHEQAARIGHSVAEEIDFLFVHGLLHLLGFDHERSVVEDTVMQALQDRALGRAETSDHEKMLV